MPVWPDSRWSTETHPPGKFVSSERIEFCSPFLRQALFVALANAQQAHIGKTVTLTKCFGMRPNSANRRRILNGRWPNRMCHRRSSRCSADNAVLTFGHEVGSSFMLS